MLDPKYLRHAHSIQEVSKQLALRGYTLNISLISRLEAQRKLLQSETERLQNISKQHAKAIGLAKSQGRSIITLLKEAAALKTQRECFQTQLNEVVAELSAIYLSLPNLPHPSVPVGQNESQNQIMRHWGKPCDFDFPIKDHVTLGEESGFMDFTKASQIAGARFVVLTNKLAKLQRILIQFMMDVHTKEHRYQEVYVPYMANTTSLMGTGQLPNFAEELFAIKGNQAFYMIPTAEVSVTNLARDVIYSAKELPKKYVAHTPCFRSEAGSYGKDTRGMIRQHQFEKVELVRLVEPENSEHALEELTQEAEQILQKLELPYRVVALCTGDLGFSSAKTYDLEVWLPSQNSYREISSCSNFETFQARRLSARWRRPDTEKIEFIHTLNASGLAVGRTLVALMENYQTKEGKIRVPEILKPYMQEDFI